MKAKRTQKLFAPAILFFISILLTSCGVWTDFTTYFNTYYNARTLFDETEKAILLQKNDPFVFREDQPNQLPGSVVNTQQNVRQTTQTNITQTAGIQRTQAGTPAQINQDLTKVIEKCSKILQFEQESSFFDDALFMTGKAFYYQGEYARAQRKFFELEALPESDYALENKLWLAKTYLQLRSFDEGLALIEKVKEDALANDEEELFQSASIFKIGFLVYREEYTNAINESQNLLKNIDDDEIAALVNYQMGKIYMKQGDEESALNAFSSVLDFSPTFEIEFESRLQHALLLKELDRLDESEDEYNLLLESGKFKNETGRILVELGTIYYQKGDNDKAIDTFIEVDTTYKNTQASGTASFMIATIYEKQFGIYDSAYKYYNKTVVSSAPYDVKVDAGSYVRNIDKYFTLKKTLSGYEKSFLYLSEPTRFMQDSIDYELAHKDYMEDVKYKVDSIVTNAQATQVVTENQKKMYEQQVQSLMQQAAVKNSYYRRKDYKPTLKELIVQGKVSKPQMPVIKEDSVKTLLSREYYNLGSLFFSELEVPDSAYYYFNIILKNFYGKSVTAPTLFALGTYYETTDQKEKADSMFSIIYEEYKNDPLYEEAGIKLGKIKRDEKKVIAAGSDPAQEEYIKAENNYYEGNYREAINGLTKVYLGYPKSQFMQKALYFIGLIYEEKLKDYDSAAVYYAILSSKEYSDTPYGKAVLAKFSEYKALKDAEEAEKQKEVKEKLKLEKVNIVTDSAMTVPDSSLIEKKLNDGLEKDKVKRPTGIKDLDSSKIKQKPFEEKNNKLIPEEGGIKKDSIDTKEDSRKEAFRKKTETIKPDSTNKNPLLE